MGMAVNDLTVQPSAIGWGKYKTTTGPFFFGNAKIEEARPNDPFWTRVLWCLSRTEGGSYNSLNLYDRCRLSPGPMQLCELHGLTTKLLVKLEAYAPTIFRAYMGKHRVPYEWREHGGRLVLWNLRDREAVIGAHALNRFWHGGSDGTIWTDTQKNNAKHSAAVLASLLGAEPFRRIHNAHVAAMMPDFLRSKARSILDIGSLVGSETGWHAAMVAAVTTFAVNNPARAERELANAQAQWESGWDARERCIHTLRHMTFNGFDIWPHRYNAIRKSIEAMFGVDLPDFADELHAWQAMTSNGYFATVAQWQAALIALGYDLGPSGADNRAGRLTTAALKDFERSAGLHPDGRMDEQTMVALVLTASEEPKVLTMFDDLQGLNDRLWSGEDVMDTIADMMANVEEAWQP